MTSPEWWNASKRPGKVKEQPRRPSGRLWTLRKGDHDGTLDLRLVESHGAETVLNVDSEMRARFYRRTYFLQMLDAIAATGGNLTAVGARRSSAITGVPPLPADGRS